jgi:NAD(P)-dependent dehydrogenase (short-subunit alcohol dehydrogenase family)
MTDRKTALVTGAAHGIGAAIAARLANDGWTVLGADLQAPEAPHPGVIYVRADVGDEAQVAGLVNRLRDQFGRRLDGLVCNAGVMVRKPLSDLTLADWSRVLTTNLTSIFLLARATADLLAAAQGGIVTIASTRARMSEPDTESYAASKGGMVALTHALAVSLGPAVRANCISPGWIDVAGAALRPIDHAQHPAGRVGTPADIAALAAWLLGPESGFVTGAEFVVDGGMTRKMIYAE